MSQTQIHHIQIWSVSRLPKKNLLFHFSLITLLGSIIYQQRAAEETGQDAGSFPWKLEECLAGLCGISLSFPSRKSDVTHLKVSLSHLHQKIDFQFSELLQRNKIICRFIFCLLLLFLFLSVRPKLSNCKSINSKNCLLFSQTFWARNLLSSDVYIP